MNPLVVRSPSPSHTADVELIQALASRGRLIVETEFADLGAGALFAAKKLQVDILPGPSADCRWGQMVVHTDADGATIKLIAPSAYDPSSEYDNDWHLKNLTHEITGAFLWLYHPPMSTWELKKAPCWFVEGLEEYVAIEHTTCRVKGRYEQRYFPRLARETVSACFAKVEDVYADGYLLTRFFHEQYGKQTLHDVLRRENGSFWNAVEQITGAPIAAIYENWLSWSAATLRSSRPTP